MTRALSNLPGESDLLCEQCGYALNGLPENSNCPECGSPTADSAPSRRGPPAWERPGAGALAFLSTTTEVLFHPKRFYRSFTTRQPSKKAYIFATIHWLITSLLLGAAMYAHAGWFMYLAVAPAWLRRILEPMAGGVLLYSAAAFLTLKVTTRIAARLTNWEATYRGYRLPLPVVLRGLDYHAAHYLPVALLSAMTVLGYRWLLYRHWVDALADTAYLYTISAEVLICAAYLFVTYWTGMRNMMYANA